MSFAGRIAIGLGAAVVSLLLFAFVVDRDVAANVRESRRLISNDEQALADTSVLERMVIDMETGLRGFGGTGEEVYLEPYRRAVSEYPDRIEALSRLLGAEQRGRLAQIRAGIEQWRRTFAEPRIAFGMAHPARPVPGGRLFPSVPTQIDAAAGKKLMDALRTRFDDLENLERANILAAIERMRQRETVLSGRLWEAAVGLSLLFGIGAFTLFGSFRRRAGELFRQIEAIERGDYRAGRLGGRDEVGRVADALDRMAGELERRDEELRRALDEAEASNRDLDAVRRQLTLVLESISEGVVVANEAGEFVIFNPSAERIIGVGPRPDPPADWPEIYGTFLEDGVTVFPAEEQPLMRAIRGESCDEVAMVIRNPSVPDGVELSISGRPVRDDKGAIKGGVVTFRDVSVRRKAEREVARLNARLEIQVAELEAFSYSVSHDLRAPLRAIDGFSQMVLEDYAGRLDPAGADALRRIRAAGQRMGDLIDDLLKLSRITRSDLRNERVDLTALARSVAKRLLEREPEGRVRLTIEEAMAATGDAKLLEVMLENLIGNALKFSSKKEEPVVEFGARAENGETIYFVRDNGAGFDMAYAHKLFGPFQRLHAMEEFPGTGIGLATVQRIVARHGGRVRAEGAPGAGATISFTLGQGEAE
jgi:signal transduction histidine kinase/CHASE3 domain sensor protein